MKLNREQKLISFFVTSALILTSGCNIHNPFKKDISKNNLPTPTQTLPNTITTEMCGDGINNDGDRYSDVDDLDCGTIFDNTVIINPHPKPCEDHLDNDGDGEVDFPHDPQCESGSDGSESR